MASIPEPLLPLEPNPVIDAYKRDVDRTVLRENLRRSASERVERLQEVVRTIHALQQARREQR